MATRSLEGRVEWGQGGVAVNRQVLVPHPVDVVTLYNFQTK